MAFIMVLVLKRTSLTSKPGREFIRDLWTACSGTHQVTRYKISSIRLFISKPCNSVEFTANDENVRGATRAKGVPLHV